MPCTPRSAQQVLSSVLGKGLSRGLCGPGKMGTWEETTQSQEELAHLQLAAAAALSFLALWVVSRVIKGRRRPGTRGSKGKVPSGDEGTSIHVVGENIVANQFTEQQYQVKEFHPLTLAAGVRWKGGNERR